MRRRGALLKGASRSRGLLSPGQSDNQMLSLFRSKIGNFVMLGILAIGLIAIVVTGFGTDGMGGLGGANTGPSTTTVVEVAGRELSDADVSQRIDGRYRQAVRQQPTLDRGRFIDEAFAPLFDRIVSDNAIVAFGRSLGMSVPQSLVDRELVQIPAFQNVAGQFDPAAFRALIAQQNITERQLRDDIADSEMIRMVVAPVGSEVRVPRAVAIEYANLLLEQRRGSLGGVPVQLVAQNLNPSDQEIAAFYTQNQSGFLIPERRVLRYALIGRDQFGDAVRATDPEIQAYYQANQAQYGPSETRNIQRIILPDAAAANAFVQRVRGGVAFAAAAQQAGFAPADINFPNQNRRQFTAASNPQVAAAAFAAAQGAVAGPVRSDLGFQVVRVEAINRTPPRPLAAVRGEIVAAIEQRKLAERINATTERVQQQLDDGASFEEIAQAERLDIQTTPPITATGVAPGVQGALPGQVYQFPAALAPLLQATFDFSPDDNPRLEDVQPEAQAALVSLVSVTPPVAPPLQAIRDQVRTRLIQRTALQRARAIADGIVTRLNAGMAPAQAYAQAGLTLPPPRQVVLRRAQIATAGQEVPPPLRMLFSIPQGRARVLAAPSGGGWIIVHHQQRLPGNAAANAEGAQIVERVQQGFRESAAGEIQEEFARAVTLGITIERNEQAILALRQRLRGGAR